MLGFIIENGGSIAVTAVVAIIAILAARSVYKNRKGGGCSCGCAGCPSSKTCKK